MSSLIDSPRHPRIAAARRLHRRSSREDERLFLVEGRQAVGELLRCATANEIFATADALARNADILAGHEVQLVSERVASSLSDTVTPQGLVAVAPFTAVDLDAAVPPGARLAAVLIDARDPGNAGTVIRVADAAGAEAVILAGDSVDPHNGKCVRSAAGSSFHLPVVSSRSVDEVVQALRARGLLILAADGGATEELPALAADGRLAGPTAWLFGNEAHGLSAEILALADLVVRVPIYGQAESLNLATAAAVCLYASAVAGRAAR